MVDLDELDAMHAKLPSLDPIAVCDEFSETWRATIASADDSDECGAVGQHERMTETAESAVAILNAWPAISHELRTRRAGQKCGDMPTCRYRPAEVTFDGRTVTVMNSRDAHVLADTVAELAALRALAEVVKARCDMANPGWAPEIREALALVEKARTP